MNHNRKNKTREQSKRRQIKTIETSKKPNRKTDKTYQIKTKLK